jgi:hypothetical protein
MFYSKIYWVKYGAKSERINQRVMNKRATISLKGKLGGKV